MRPARSDLQLAVEQRMGRNLLRYQLVEQRLKVLLPLRMVELSIDGIEDLRARSAKLQGQTLGHLAGIFLGADGEVSSAHRAALINEFVDNRNWLTHRLLSSHGFLLTDADCTACIDRLDRDYEAAAVVADEVLVATRVTIKLFKAFVEAWEKAGADLSEGSELMASLERHLGDEVPIHISVTFPPAPLESILALTMRKLHRERKDAEGWAYFANVAPIARRETPDLPKKGLLKIARSIEGFEFAQRPAGAPNAGWMFRVTAPSDTGPSGLKYE